MRGPTFARIFLTLWCLALATLAAEAQDVQDGQVWVQAVAIGQLSKAWRSHLEFQPRFFDNGSELGITIARVAIGRQITPRVSLWGGYAWIPRSLGPTTLYENRVWQQLLVALPPAGAWSPSLRFRTEQRWLDQWNDTVHRVRLMVRAQRPWAEGSPWHVAVYDEAMVTLDTTTPGPASGYDRNRLFGGIGRRLSPTFTSEFGYLWENSTIRGPLQRNDHVAMFVLNINWPRQP
jgi:hypothetical protein